MAGTELRLLDDVFDVYVPVVTVAEVTLDSLALVANYEDDFLDTDSDDGFDDVF